ncbi:MAG TPA: hypothetical protein VNT56_07580 [Acidimicrobiales bacterium]|nr:hypothetical protein [Acidimicrobiales bacterium]
MEPRRREPLRASGRSDTPPATSENAAPPESAPARGQSPPPQPEPGTYQPSWSSAPPSSPSPGPPPVSMPSPQGAFYDATPGLVMGIVGYVFGGLFLHIPAFIMGRRGRAVRQAGGTEKFADASYWLGLIGIILAAVAAVFGLLVVIIALAT